MAAALIKSLFPALLSFILLPCQYQAQVAGGDEDPAGFTVDLIHRDTPLLHSLTTYDLVNRAIKRSNSRHRHFSSVSSPTAPAFPGGASGDYIMNITIGNPPVPFLGLVDTGSDLIWTQCNPCIRCYHQTTPIFNPRASSTYNFVSCSAAGCKWLPPDSRHCSRSWRARSRCSYHSSYADNSVTEGELGTETLTLGGKVRVNGVVFGCGHYNHVSLTELESGLIGLGSGSLSLIGQTRNLPVFGGRFSHCLVPPSLIKGKTHSGRISFGRKAMVSGLNTVTTPLKTKKSLYYITLESISLGRHTIIPYISKRPAADRRKEEKDGNIFIDSGTPLTYLKESSFHSLVSKVKAIIHAQPVTDPSGEHLDLCYHVEEEEGDYRTRLGIPNLTFRFAGGADVVLKPSSTFVAVDEGVVCLAIMPTHDRAIFGSFLQMGYVIGFDLQAKAVSFKPTTPDCTTDP